MALTEVQFTELRLETEIHFFILFDNGCLGRQQIGLNHTFRVETH